MTYGKSGFGAAFSTSDNSGEDTKLQQRQFSQGEKIEPSIDNGPSSGVSFGTDSWNSKNKSNSTGSGFPPNIPSGFGRSNDIGNTSNGSNLGQGFGTNTGSGFGRSTSGNTNSGFGSSPGGRFNSNTCSGFGQSTFGNTKIGFGSNAGHEFDANAGSGFGRSAGTFGNKDNDSGRGSTSNTGNGFGSSPGAFGNPRGSRQQSPNRNAPNARDQGQGFGNSLRFKRFPADDVGKSHDAGSFHLKASFIPSVLPKEELYQMRISEGDRISEMFSSKIEVTADNSKFELKPYKSFDDMKLVPELRDYIHKSGYKTPLPIQRQVMPVIRLKRDLMACAQTGSGKTAAYLLPILQNLFEDNDFAQPGTQAHPRCIIFAPTRELADQIFNEGRKFVGDNSSIMGRVYGGVEMSHCRIELTKGPSIIVGTMGRLLHRIREQAIYLDCLRYCVIDEADRMLSIYSEFADNIRELLAYGPPKQQRATFMFSATYPELVQRLAIEHLRPDFIMVAIDKIGSANRCIKQEFIEVTDSSKKQELILDLLKVDVKTYDLRDSSMTKLKTLVFVNRKNFADHLGLLLSEAGLPSATIHGDRDQEQRDKVITEFKKGEKAVLIATAVAERGLDIEGVDHVINYDLPQTIEEYVHRIGRTGRVGNEGRATSFFDATEREDLMIAASLVSNLIDAGQTVPDFLVRAMEMDGIGMLKPMTKPVLKLKSAAMEEEW